MGWIFEYLKDDLDEQVLEWLGKSFAESVYDKLRHGSIKWKIEEKIIDEIIEAESDLKSSDPNIHNLAQNRLVVLELMFKRLNNDWYDDESDFDAEYQNTVDELVEAYVSP